MKERYSSLSIPGFLILALFLTVRSSAQNYTERPEYIKANSNWIHDVFQVSGTMYRYDFNTNPPTVTSVTPIYPPASSTFPYTYENRTAVSDTATGDLLFFTNGGMCYNRNYTTMPNGDSLLGSYSANEGCLIVPVLDSPGKFYLFTVGASEDVAGIPLCYSVIDMNLDGGLGDIIPGRKNIVLDPGPMQESLIGIPGNNCDVWLLVHPQASTIFKAYHITRQGIDPTPVVSSPGTMISGAPYTFEGGSMSVSPDRSMVAIGSFSYSCPLIGWQSGLGGLMVTRFDPETGEISNGIQINNFMANYSSCFSPDGTKLYAHGIMTDSTGTDTLPCSIMQYDVSTYTQSAIMASEYLVAQNPNTFNGIITSLRRWNDTIIISYDLAHITSPNLAGSACNLQISSYLPTQNIYAGGTLGLDAIYPLPPDTIFRLVLDTTMCESFVLEAPASYTQYLWDNNVTGVTREVNSGGTYWVAYNDGCHYGVDTFHVDAVDLNPFITVNVMQLGTTQPYSTYQWMMNGGLLPGATNSTLQVLANGDYQVIVSDGVCTDTSAVYTVTNAVGIHEEGYEAKYVLIYPNPGTDIIHVSSSMDVGVAITTIDGRVLALETKYTKPMSVSQFAAGTYLIKIYDIDGNVIKTEKFIKNP